MTQLTINVGSSANDKTGDPIRTAFTKVNANFTDLYTQLSGLSLDAVIPSQTGNNGKYLTTNGTALNWATAGTSTGIQDGPSLAYIDGVGGSFVVSISDSDSVWTFGVGGEITFPGGSVQHGAYGGPDFPSVTGHGGSYLTTNGVTLTWSAVPADNTLTNGSYILNLGADGTLNLPQAPSAGAAVIQPDDTTFGLKLVSNGNVWAYGTDGGLTFPDNSYIKNSLWQSGTGITLQSANTYETDVISDGVNGWAKLVTNKPTVGNMFSAVTADSSSSSVTIQTIASTNNTWTFNGSGNLTVPGNITFPQSKLGVPNVNGTTDAVRLYDFGEEGTQYNYAIGSEGSWMWFNVDQANSDELGFKFYGGGTQAAKITTAGNLYLNGSITFSGTITTAGDQFIVDQYAHTNPGDGVISIGQYAGSSGQGAFAVAIGGTSGQTNQGANAVAIGNSAGADGQGTGAVGIGIEAGFTEQGSYAVAIGSGAGETIQGANAIAIGYGAGNSQQPANTIILNATGSNINGVASQTNSFYVAPIRTDATPGNILYYNTSTNEVTYGSVASPSSLVNGSYTLSLAANGDLLVPTSQYGTAQIFAATDGTTLFLGNSSHYVQVRGSDAALVFADSSVQTTAYQVAKSGFNVQYPSVQVGTALFNIDNAGHPTIGATAGTWSGPWTAQSQTWNGSEFVTTTYGATSNTWTSIASYGFGPAFSYPGDQVVGYFTDNDQGHIYKVTWIATATGPSTGYGFISVETIV